MARKNKDSKKRASQKILDAYQIAERAERRRNGDSDLDSEADEDNGTIINSRRLLGDKKNDNSDDDEFVDEEIDSDEALGSDDDYDVLNSKFSQTIRDKKKARKSKDYESDEGEEVYDSIDESELIPLSEVWDRDEKDLKKAQKAGANNDIVLDDKWESESSEESESDSEEDDDEDQDSDDEDVFGGLSDDDEDADLVSTVASLKKQIQKPKQKKKLLNETIQENEFNLPSNGKKLTLAEMMSAVDSSISKEAILINKNDESDNDSKALAVPLPKRIQDRHERKVAYEITKDEVNKWEDTVKSNRKAEVLKFPLNPRTEHNETSSFKSDAIPSSELEIKVHNLLKESSLVDDTKEATFEEIATAKMSVEDLKKRTNELRLMRELMFREEKKARRVKKIKSKLYHRIKKKEMIRNQELIEGDESDAEDHDMKRAKERMTMKHKTQSSWAKSMIKSGLSKDAANRGELEEMLRQGERLKSKILGHEDGEQSDKDLSDIENDYEKTHDEEEDNQTRKLGKGVMAMDFMKNAELKQKQENIKEMELLRKLENGGDVESLEEETNSANVNMNQGRRIYTPTASATKDSVNESNQSTLQENEIDETKSLSNRLSKKYKISNGGKSTKTGLSAENEESRNSKETEEESNPWLASTESTHKSNKINKVDKESSAFEKSAMKIKKSKKRSGAKVDQEDAIIDMNETLKIVDAYGSDNEGNDNEDETQIHMFKQKNLIKQAFAGDDVVREFEEEKRQVIIDEGDKEEDLTLPGWGDWAGGSKKNKKKKIVKKIAGVVAENNRKDKKLKNVIINEKVNKKNLKYQSSAVPFPYESREQYERALRMPIGQEWTTRSTHQKLTMPSVIVKQGTIIDPLKKPNSK